MSPTEDRGHGHRNPDTPGEEESAPAEAKEIPTAGADDAPEDTADADEDDAPGAGEDDASPADTTLHFEALPDSPTCPFCGGTETEQFAAFGSAASTSQFYCRPCRSVFEFLKWRES